jgi:hypothetical protein
LLNPGSRYEYAESQDTDIKYYKGCDILSVKVYNSFALAFITVLCLKSVLLHLITVCFIFKINTQSVVVLAIVLVYSMARMRVERGSLLPESVTELLSQQPPPRTIRHELFTVDDPIDEDQRRKRYILEKYELLRISCSSRFVFVSILDSCNSK